MRLLSHQLACACDQDFNFCAYGDWAAENENICAAFTDVWAVLQPAERGYTEDTATNLMLAFDRNNEPKQVRFDRVIVHSARWRPVRMSVIGREPLGNGMPGPTPPAAHIRRCLRRSRKTHSCVRMLTFYAHMYNGHAHQRSDTR